MHNSIDDSELKKVRIRNSEEEIDNSVARIFDDVLNKDEKVVKALAPSKKMVYFIKLIKPLLVFFAFITITLVLYLHPKKFLNLSDFIICFVSVFVLTCIAEIIIFMVTKKALKTTFYLLTNKRIVISYGISRINFKSINTNNIKDVELKMGFISKLTRKKFGQIVFTSTNEEELIIFDIIEKPLENYIQIENFLGDKNA